MLIDRLHQAGIGVILDWVPGHFATDEWALARFDGTPLYEDPNPQRGWHKEWGSHIFNFGRHEVRNFLYANALYWLEEFHADGLRVDGVASMLYLDYAREHGEWSPNVHGGRENLEAVQFLQEMNATVYKRVPGVVTIAEESTVLAGGHAARPPRAGWASASSGTWAGCTTRWATSSKDPIYRSHHHGQMTFSLVYAFTENYVLPISHDEVVHGKGSLLRKMPGDRWQQLANLRAYLAFMWAHPGKQLLFMGAEFGQESEWAESRELDWWLLEHPEHAGVHAHGARPQPRPTSRRARCGAGTTRPRASSGSTPTTPTATSSRSCAAPPVSRTSCAWPTSRPSRTRATGSPLPATGTLGGDPQHRRCGLHRVGRRQPRRASRRSRARRTASPAYADIVVPPLATTVVPQGVTGLSDADPAQIPGETDVVASGPTPDPRRAGDGQAESWCRAQQAARAWADAAAAAASASHPDAAGRRPGSRSRCSGERLDAATEQPVAHRRRVDTCAPGRRRGHRGSASAVDDAGTRALARVRRGHQDDGHHACGGAVAGGGTATVARS